MADSGARAAILGAIRSSLGRGPLDDADKAPLEARLAAPRANIVPARAALPHGEQVDLFVTMAEQVSASVDRVAGDNAVPAAVADYLARQNLPSALVMAPDPALDAYDWDERSLLTIRRGKAEDADQVGVTGALMGFAETGTLMMASGPDHPSTLNFLPETHVVVIRASQIAGSYEAGWELLRARHAAAGNTDAGFMPRTVNLITGPSRTGDIEQRIELGAHGPRRLHIIVVEDGE